MNAGPREVQCGFFSSAEQRNSGSLAPFSFSFAFSTRINGSPPMVFRVCLLGAGARPLTGGDDRLREAIHFTVH